MQASDRISCQLINSINILQEAKMSATPLARKNTQCQVVQEEKGILLLEVRIYPFLRIDCENNN